MNCRRMVSEAQRKKKVMMMICGGELPWVESPPKGAGLEHWPPCWANKWRTSLAGNVLHRVSFHITLKVSRFPAPTGVRVPVALLVSHDGTYSPTARDVWYGEEKVVVAAGHKRGWRHQKWDTSPKDGNTRASWSSFSPPDKCGGTIG